MEMKMVLELQMEVPVTELDLEKFRAYTRALPKFKGAEDGDLMFEHAVAQKVERYKWSVNREPGLSIDEYLKSNREPWLTLPKKPRRRPRG